MKRSRLANLSEAEVHVLREASRISRDAARVERRLAKSERVARAREVLKTAEANARKPRERDPKFLSWLRRAPCLVCEILDLVQVGRTDPAHVRRAYPEPGWRPVGGAEKPSDFRCLPICRTHHEQQHATDNHQYYAAIGIYPPDVCASLKAAQVHGADPAEVIHEIASDIKRNMLERGVK